MPPAPLASSPTEASRDRLRRACASLDLAELTGSPFAMSQALAEVARSHRELHDEAAAELHFAGAVRWARWLGSVDQLAELLCEHADAAVRVALAAELQALLSNEAPDAEARRDDGQAVTTVASRAARERARDRAFEASQLVSRVSDPSCEARLLLRVSEVLQRCGDHADALQMQRRALNRLGGIAPRDAEWLPALGRLADA
ncbi:MAG: hypothetical protein JNL85_00885 [Rubrivivax sp.]|nr:hypothetical protein [Rubrivivax sp.]